MTVGIVQAHIEEPTGCPRRLEDDAANLRLLRGATCAVTVAGATLTVLVFELEAFYSLESILQTS